MHAKEAVTAITLAFRAPLDSFFSLCLSAARFAAARSASFLFIGIVSACSSNLMIARTYCAVGRFFRSFVRLFVCFADGRLSHQYIYCSALHLLN